VAANTKVLLGRLSAEKRKIKGGHWGVIDTAKAKQHEPEIRSQRTKPFFDDVPSRDEPPEDQPAEKPSECKSQ
jgi:hypothetical protein